MELSDLSVMSPVCGADLSSEEYAGLESAMIQRRLQENLGGKMLFWGKISGTNQDYLIVYSLDTFPEFPTKKFFFCTTGDYNLKALPENSDEYKEKACEIKTLFLGDPSFFGYNGEDAEAEEDPDAPPVEKFREINRLTQVVTDIEHDCSIVPRGAVALDATKKVKFTGNSYSGLSYQTSLELRAYMHMRYPESLQCVSLLKRPGIIKTDDFLDCIDKDEPSEMWSVSHDNAAANVYVRNLYWEGFGFYARLQTEDYGCVYFGNGLANHDIAFMI